jgi:hypothetical protein
MKDFKLNDRMIESENVFYFQIENIRRKHNYLPFIMELLKTLAEHQQLIPLVEKVSGFLVTIQARLGSPQSIIVMNMNGGKISGAFVDLFFCLVFCIV